MGISRLYKAGTPYNAVELADLDYEQAADVIYFAHRDHAPGKIVRAGHTDWTYSTVTFGPTIAAPTGLSATPSSPNVTGYHAISFSYVVTAVDDATGQESRASAVATCSNDLTLNGNYNTLSWSAVAGADRYIVYKNESGSDADHGYIGSTTALSFVDRNIAADLSDTPPKASNPFSGANDYPSTVTFFEQRSIWGNTRNKPNGVFGSRSADFENMDVSRPAKADDALSFGIVSSRVNAINQLVGMKNLLALTSDAVFAVSGATTDDPLTPSSISSKRQSGRGSARLKPIVVDNVVFFRPNQGSSIRTLGFTFELDGYQSNNVTIFSPHLFEGYSIRAWAYQQEPYSCIWVARSDGKLLCLTWEQEQQVWGWSVHDLGGTVEDVCTITENGMDRLYLAVRRTLGGQESVFIERMALPVLVETDLVNACHLDCAYSQTFEEPTETVSQLWHLESETVSVFADGNVYEGLVVENGTITLPSPASVVTVGLPYSGKIETLPLPLSGNSGTAHTNRQMIGGVVIRCENTRGLWAGPSGGEMFEIKQRNYEALGDPIALKTGDFDVKTSAKWNEGAGVVIEQRYPLPATVTGLFPEIVLTK